MDKFTVGDIVEIIEGFYFGLNPEKELTVKEISLENDMLLITDGNKEAYKRFENVELIKKEDASNNIKIRDRVVVTDDSVIGFDVNEVLDVSDIISDNVIEVVNTYGDIGVIQTKNVRLFEKKERLKVGDFVKVIKTNKNHISIGTVGLVSYVYCDGAVDLALVDEERDFYHDLIFEPHQVKKIKVGEL